MKHLIFLATLLGIGGLSLGLLIYTTQERQLQRQTLLKANTLPHFSFLTAQGDRFTSRDLTPNKPVLLFHFSPECNSCWAQLAHIADSSLAQSNLQLILTTAADEETLAAIQTWSVSHFSFPFTVLRASKAEFRHYFGTRAAPAVYCYDANWHLQERFVGEVKASTLLPYFPPHQPSHENTTAMAKSQKALR